MDGQIVMCKAYSVIYLPIESLMNGPHIPHYTLYRLIASTATTASQKQNKYSWSTKILIYLVARKE